MGRRTADPWADTDVIDARVPRFNQVIVGLVALLGLIFGWPLAWAPMALQLFIGLTAGRRYCLTCLAYFVLVQPRFGEGPLEDSRPPRLANMMGCAFLSAAAVAWWLGATTLGVVLAAIVAALALLAAGSAPFLKLDVRERPDLAHKYGIAVVPTVLVVDPRGTVPRRLAP